MIVHFTKSHPFHRFISSCVLLAFIFQIIFPPQVAAQVMAVPMPVVPQVVSPVPVVTPGEEREKNGKERARHKMGTGQQKMNEKRNP
jgi:hypothetical protein